MVKREDKKELITRQRQQQILEAALGVFSKHGFDRATIPDIAREAGIAVGTIYNYYESKRELLVAIANKYVMEPFAEIIKHGNTEDDTAFITKIMENRLNFGLENIGTFLPMFNEVQKDDELRQAFSENVLGPVMNVIENFIRTRTKDGAFRKTNTHLSTRAVAGMIIGFLILSRFEGEDSPVHTTDRRRLAAELADLIYNGLRKP